MIKIDVLKMLVKLFVLDVFKKTQDGSYFPVLVHF